jgi:transposase
MALRVTMSSMKPYSEDLRTRIVKAVGDGMSMSTKAARLFGVSLSSTKRYVKIANRGEPLRPRKGGGRPPKTDELTKKLLEEDLQERPAATISERRSFLERACGKSLSDSTVRRLLKRMGFSQKTDCGGDGAKRVAEGRLEGDARPTDRSKAAGVRR